MKKLFKRIAVSLTAFALSVPIALSAAACKVEGDGNDKGNDDPPTHTHSYAYKQNTDGKTHTGTCNAAGTCTEKTVTGNCVDVSPKDGKCDICNGNVQAEEGENPPTPPTPTVQHTVTFHTNDGTNSSTAQTIDDGGKATSFSPVRSGYAFGGWYRDADCSAGQEYNFGDSVTGDLDLYAKWTKVDARIISQGAYNESLFATWKDGNPAEATVEYAETGHSDYVPVPAQLIRAVSVDEARVDIIGLKAGVYNVKITSSDNTELILPAVSVSEYDRSGYAHFNYNTGVGAYTDEGTLKDGALVIYVTDENKNDVTDSVYKYNAATNSYTKENIEQYITTTQTYDPATSGVTGGVQKGIGQILNNRRYSMNGDRWNVGIARLTREYGAVAIRIVGTVKSECTFTAGSKCSILGLTDYDSTLNGGSDGDNGSMARMVNAKNLTIEGVGDDATVDGWGFHFIHTKEESNQPAGSGTSFEVRNLTFQNNPEDAVGMEGEEEEGTLTLHTPVERCWIHNNTFLPGYCPNPAPGENDKAEGDGSCDFKRGMYFTASYNYFENCHKTNLLGSSKTSLQFCVTYHHNWWNGCKARQPLARRANIHFYNNYVSGTTDTVSSLRANAYMFSEANFIYCCNRAVEDGGEGGTNAAKSYNDIYLCNYNDNIAKVVTDRETKVTNNCTYEKGGVDYTSFDTDPTLFYYDSANKKTDALVDTAMTARVNCIKKAGANGHGDELNSDLIEYKPTVAVQLEDEGETVITLPTSKNDVDVKGVAFRTLTGASSGTVSFKGQGIFFTLTAPAAIKITGTGDKADYYPILAREDGYIIADKFSGTIEKELEAGTYFITSGIGKLQDKNAKECDISALSFTALANASERAVTALEAIPSSVTLADSNTVAAARAAYDNLKSADKQAFDSAHSDLVKKLTDAETTLADLVEGLIDEIGDVNADSYDKIHAARTAYDSLTAPAKTQVQNYKKLTDAESAFANIAVTAINNKLGAFLDKIDAIQDLEGEGKTKLGEYKTEAAEIEAMYGTLTSEQQGQVNRYSELQPAVGKIAQALLWFDFTDQLAYFDEHPITDNKDGDKVTALTAAYNALSPEQQQKAETGGQKAKYDKVLSDYEPFKPKVVEAYFDGGKADSGDNVIRAKGGASTTKTLGGTAHTGMKFESGDGVIIISLTSKATVTFYVSVSKGKIYYSSFTATNTDADLTHPGKNFSTAGLTSVEGTDNTVAEDTSLYIWTVTLEAGSYRFLKQTSLNVYYAKVEYVTT